MMHPQLLRELAEDRFGDSKDDELYTALRQAADRIEEFEEQVEAVSERREESEPDEEDEEYDVLQRAAIELERQGKFVDSEVGVFHYPDATCRPVAREGEQIFASIIRNRLGPDAGSIDFGARVGMIQNMADGERQEVVNTTWALYEAVSRYAGKKADKDGRDDQLFSDLTDAIYGDGGKGELTTVEVLQDAIRLLKSQNDEAPTKSHRERLPDTRRSITHKFKINTTKGYLTVGMYEDGRPGELFIEIAKEGSTVGGLCDAIGILTSIALQRGVPIEELARKFRGTSFEPAGPTIDGEQPKASSVVDYVFLWMGRRFSDDFREEYDASMKAMEEFGKGR